MGSEANCDIYGNILQTYIYICDLSMIKAISDPWRKSKLFNDLLAIWETNTETKTKYL